MRRFMTPFFLTLLHFLLAQAALATPQESNDEPVPFLGARAVDVDAFLADVLDMPDVNSVGVLPLYVFDTFRPDAGEPDVPWVPQLGVSLGEIFAQRLVSADERAQGEEPRRLNVLGPAQMQRRLHRVNVDARWLFDGQAVDDNAARMGVDLLIFGSARRQRARDRSRRSKHDLAVSLWAYSFVSTGGTQTKSFRLKQGLPGETDCFYPHELEEPSSWVHRADAYASPAADYDRDYEVVLELTTQDLFQQITLPAADRRVYMAPADTSELVSAVNQLRNNQNAYLEGVRIARERERRNDDRPVVITMDDREFDNVQDARNYLFAQANTLEELPASRFGRKLAEDLINEALPIIEPRRHALDLADIGFNAQSDIEVIIDQELATGGLARSEFARESLRDQGFSLVIAPRLERYAGTYRLYLTAYDLEGRRIAGTASMPFDGRFSTQIESQLGLE